MRLYNAIRSDTLTAAQLANAIAKAAPSLPQMFGGRAAELNPAASIVAGTDELIVAAEMEMVDGEYHVTDVAVLKAMAQHHVVLVQRAMTAKNAVAYRVAREQHGTDVAWQP